MSETDAFPDSVQHDPDTSSSSAGWHPLSAADGQQQAQEGMPATVGQSRPESIASGHTPLFPDSPASSRRNSLTLEQTQGRTPKSTPAAAAAAAPSPQLSLSLPAAPHQLHKQVLLDRLESYASHLSALDTTQQDIPVKVAVPVIRALSSQLEESQQHLQTLQRQHEAQINALKGLLDQHAHGIIPQYVERTLIRARAAAHDSSTSPANGETVRLNSTSSEYHGRRLSSAKRSWVLHLGAHDGTTLISNPDGPTAASADDTQSIDSALDEAMTDSHFDSAFTPASPTMSSHSASASKSGRTRQHSSLSARLFGGFGASSSAAPSSSVKDNDRDSLRSATVQSETAQGGESDEPSSSSASQPAERRQRAVSLSDWAGSVLTWRSASNRKHASTPPITAGALPEQSEESSSPQQRTSPSARDSALPSQLETPRRPRLNSSASSSSRSTTHGTVLSSSHPTLETTPSLRQQQQQHNAPSSRPPSHRELMSSPTPSSSSTPSSAVRALISKKQIEPPALSVPQLSRGSAETSSMANMSLSPTALSPSLEVDGEPTEAPLSPRLRPAPDADALPHDVGSAPMPIKNAQSSKSSPNSQPASLPSSMPLSQTEHQATTPIPRPVRPTRSKSSSSHLSKSSSNRGVLPRSGSYMSSMMDALNRTVAYVAPPQSAGGAAGNKLPQPASMSRRGSAQGDGRIEPTVTLPSLGITQQGSIFQLAPAKAASSSVVQQAQAIGSAMPVGGTAASSSSAANAPPLSMELPTIVASEARPPTFASSNSQMRGLDDLVDRYGFLHEANGAKTVRDLRQRQWDASNASGGASSSAQDEPGEDDAAAAAAPQTSVKRLLLQLDDMYESQERTQQATWDAFLKRRKAQLAPTDNSPARKERPGSMAFSASRSGAAALNDNFKEGEEDMWTENLIGVARMGNSGKEGKSTWKEFKSLVRSGIPVKDRPAIWAELSGANDQREPGYYQGLLRHFDEGEEGHDTLCVKQIDADVGRTFGTNVFFGGDGPGVVKLRRVLLAYSWHNPEVGYCQGMNLIAGSLLLALPTEEDAFWILLCIIERILPSDYFTSTLLVSRADQRVLNDMVARHLPKIAAHLEDVGIELEAVSFGWFLSLFSLPLPIRTLLRVFDIFFVDGAIVLFRVAAALLQYNAEAILACDNASDLYVLLRTMTTSLHDADQLVKIACDEFKVIKTKDVATLRQRYVAELEASMAPVTV